MAPVDPIGIDLPSSDQRQGQQKSDDARSLLEAIRHVQQLAIAEADSSQVFDFLLNEILTISESEYGFIGEVHQGDDGFPFLKTHAITNIAWNEETRRFVEMNTPNGLEFHNLHTLFGHVMTTGLPVVSNDPNNDPRRAGLPDGHPALDSFLGVPLQDVDGMVGMLGVANRPGGYDEPLIEFLSPLVSTAAGLVRAYQARRARLDAERELRRSEERWRRSLERASQPIIVWDERRILLYVNGAAAELLQCRAEVVVGRHLDDFLQADEIDHREAIHRLRTDGWSHRISYFLATDGDKVPVELHAVDLGDGTFQGTAVDMREWITIEGKLQEAAQHDNLTGLLNRRAIEEHAEVEIHRARRRANAMSLLMVDVDHFKRINDVHGHLAGDAALQRIAELVSSCTRPYDWVGRWGGEEFLVVLPETNEEQALTIGERIRTAVATEPLEVSPKGAVSLTASVGVATVATGTTMSLLQLFERVDLAMYSAKKSGRNLVRPYADDLGKR